MLDPEIEAMFAGASWDPPLPDLASLPTLRGWMAATGRTLPAPDMDVEDHDADGVPLRLYRPCDRTEQRLPLLVFLHGGGWIQGDLETHDAPCRILAEVSGCSVLAVGYRLAPEHPFPAALDDCMTAYAWACSEADRLGLDGTRIAIGGESAGANLAAAASLALRDDGGRRPDFQFLVHPATDLTLDHCTFDAELKGMTRPFLEACIKPYVGDTDVRDPRISPMRAPDLSGLPPAIVFTVEVDPLRSDGEEYALRLAQAGNEVLLQRLPGLPHGFMFLPNTIVGVRDAFGLLGRQIARYFSAG